MRLTQNEITGIITAIDQFLLAPEGKVEVRLYGSRVNDQLKGGDIDLLLLCEKKELAEFLESKKHYLLAAIKASLGEQKIDLKIASIEESKKDPFLKIILPGSVILK
jgi:predicted nucleotidyltransferase